MYYLCTAAVDGICLQTSESIGCAEELGLPAVVVLNKIDLLPEKEAAQVINSINSEYVRNFKRRPSSKLTALTGVYIFWAFEFVQHLAAPPLTYMYNFKETAFRIKLKHFHCRQSFYLFVAVIVAAAREPRCLLLQPLPTRTSPFRKVKVKFSKYRWG